jgi:hypothetical protein
LVFQETVAELSNPNQEFSLAMLLCRMFSAVCSAAKFAANSKSLIENLPALNSAVILSGSSSRHTVGGSHSMTGKSLPPFLVNTCQYSCKFAAIWLPRSPQCGTGCRGSFLACRRNLRVYAIRMTSFPG